MIDANKRKLWMDWFLKNEIMTKIRPKYGQMMQ